MGPRIKNVQPFRRFPSCRDARRATRARAFTLVELLLVIVVLAVLATVAAPRIAPMLSGGRLRTAARELAQAERYARSMALLNQTPIEIEVDLENGKFSVKAVPRERESVLGMSDLAATTNDVGYTDSLLATSARRTVSLGSGYGLAVSKEDREEGAFTNALEKLRYEAAVAEGENAADAYSFEGDASSGSESFHGLEAAINFDRAYEGVRFGFEGWRDTPGTRWNARETGGTDEGTVTIRYRANGTVRAHRFRVQEVDNEEDCMYVVVTPVGRTRVLDAGEEEK